MENEVIKFWYEGVAIRPWHRRIALEDVLSILLEYVLMLLSRLMNSGYDDNFVHQDGDREGRGDSGLTFMRIGMVNLGHSYRTRDLHSARSPAFSCLSS